jgi:hypothetical protein
VRATDELKSGCQEYKDLEVRTECNIVYTNFLFDCIALELLGVLYEEGENRFFLVRVEFH